MSTHHLKLNLGKTELLFLPAKGSPMIDASITVEGSIVSPSQSARSLGVTLDNQLCFSSHIAAITRTCRFSLHNIRRIRPFLTQEATQLLVQALVISRLDYCNSLLADLPACAIKPLQLVQNAALVWCSTSRSSPTSPLYSPLCTGSPSQHTSDSNHWCLLFKRPEVLLPLTSSHSSLPTPLPDPSAPPPLVN
ncbi:hypothetical protein AAFF_G00000050 [Aldrovandia affinis]|uniref:Uncharacterized protein n=1 Tax=Aldrovandia affinis TaxID=143900 RepID=A0AAD7TE09_9TELE|nr:hypothetical protein AAFF_G00000050 [Aldrovandia affinis]